MAARGELMFLGTHSGSVDAKGRLKLPAIARRRLRELYGDMNVFITSLKGEFALVYPIREWEKVERSLRGGGSESGPPVTRAKLKALLFRTNHYGNEQRVDGQGRCLVKKVLRDEAGLNGPVKVQWSINHIEVRSEAAYDKELEASELTESDLEMAAELGL